MFDEKVISHTRTITETCNLKYNVINKIVNIFHSKKIFL